MLLNKNILFFIRLWDLVRAPSNYANKLHNGWRKTRGQVKEAKRLWKLPLMGWSNPGHA